MIKTLVAVLHQGWVRPELMFAPVLWGRNESVHYLWAAMDTKPTTDCRNRICGGFLEHPEKPDVLMMIDHDISVPKSPTPLIQMMAESPYDIIGTVCPTWRPDLDMHNPIRWAVYNVDGELLQDFDLNAPGLLEVDLVGSGAILIHRRVLERMRAPFMDVFRGDGTRRRGHDYQFCHRAKRLGFHIWAARDYVCGHLRLVELLDIARAGHGEK